MIPVRLFILLVALLYATFAHGQAADNYVTTIVQERADKEKGLKRKRTSPLQKNDRRHFNGLSYYPVDTAYRLSAKYIEVKGKDTLNIPTSAVRSKMFERFGLFVLNFNGDPDSLFGYKRIWPEDYVYDGEPYLFIPFNDETNGDETYGGGRYLDIPIPSASNTEVVIDFNRSYNPYCAYGGGFSCPIPPVENRLNRPILAGERNYEH